MPQIFHRYTNHRVKIGIVSFLLLAGTVFVGANVYYWGPNVSGQGVHKVQPVQFTHSHHVGGLGLDCRYCHFNVERSSYAAVPPTKVCMTCHSQMYVDAAILEPVRESYRTDMPIQWVKVHNLSDFAYFNHSAHINKGIGCAECHGRVDQMPLMYQANSLQMRWCVECHMNPTPRVRPRSEITNMEYEHPKSPDQKIEGFNMTQAELAQHYNVQSKVSCSTCHR